MKNIDVVLVNPPSRVWSTWPPLGLGYLASYLEAHGYFCEIVDIKAVERLEDKILKAIIKAKPKVVGFPCFTTEVLQIRKLSQKVKELLPGIIIVVGGPHPTAAPKDLLFESPVDYVVIGEGEETLYELVETVSKGRNPKDISGLAWWDGSRLIKTHPRPLVKDLDEIPFPAYSKLPMDFYVRPQGGLIRGVSGVSGTTIFTSRGCPYRCAFCSSRATFGRRVRFRSAQNVIDELELLVSKYHINGFYILDDTFTTNRKHVFDICHELKRRKINLIWGCETRVDLVNKELLSEMKRAGCIQIDFGVESGSQRILDILHKGFTIQQVEKAFSFCHELSIRTYANFMINNPGETWDDIRRTLKLAKKLRADEVGVWITTPYPGTDLWAMLKSPLSPDEYGNLVFGGERVFGVDANPKIKNDIFKPINLSIVRFLMQEEITKDNSISFGNFFVKSFMLSLFYPFFKKSPPFIQGSIKRLKRRSHHPS